MLKTNVLTVALMSIMTTVLYAQPTPEQQALVSRMRAILWKEACETTRFNSGIEIAILDAGLREADTAIGMLQPGPAKTALGERSIALHELITRLIGERNYITVFPHLRADNWIAQAEMFYAQRAWITAATAFDTATSLYTQARDAYQFLIDFGIWDARNRINTLRADLGLPPIAGIP